MAASTNVNGRTVVHKDSGGVATNFPDVCKTQCGPPVVPIPYPNIAFSKDTANGSKTVKVDGNPIMLKDSNFSTSTGDEPGALGGIVSGCVKGKAEFINYSFDVSVEGKSVPRLGDMMMQNKRSAFNTPPMPEVQPPLVVIGPEAVEKVVLLHARLRIEEVTFSSNHVVNKDTFGNFPSPEWLRGRQAKENSPICYTRNHPMKLTAKFKVTNKPTNKEAVAIDGIAKIGTTTISFKGSVQVGPEDSEVSVSLSGNTNLPDKVDCLDAFAIEWNYNPASTGELNAGVSTNVLYVILGDPSGELPYWTLLDISCRGAAGTSMEDDFVKASFAPFRTTIGDGKGFKRKHDGMEMSYYLRGKDMPREGVYDTKDLLTRADGTARCGAWGNFLVSVHKIHGVTSSKVRGVTPIAAKSKYSIIPNPFKPHDKLFPYQARLFLVKNCTLGELENSSKTAPFINSAKKEAGVPGQGKNNPQFVFSDHALVIHSTGIYDPSYGVGPKPDLRTWEDNAIDGIGHRNALVEIIFDKDPHLALTVCSSGFVEEVYRFTSDKITAALAHPCNAGLKKQRPPFGKPQAGDIVIIPRELDGTFPLMEI